MRCTKIVKTNVFRLLLLFATFPTHGTVVTDGCGGNPSCTLAELFLGGSIQVNDVVFDSWAINLNDGGLDENTVVVSGFDEVADPTDSTKAFVGLDFTAAPAISFDFLEYDFDFNVSISGSTRTLTEAALNLIDSTIGNDGFVEVNGNLVGAGLLQVGNPGPGITDAEPLVGLISLAVDADIQMENFIAPTPPNPTLSEFNFMFQVMSNQQPPNVPEPPLLALVGVGLFSMLFSRRRNIRFNLHALS